MLSADRVRCCCHCGMHHAELFPSPSSIMRSASAVIVLLWLVGVAAVSALSSNYRCGLQGNKQTGADGKLRCLARRAVLSVVPPSQCVFLCCPVVCCFS